MKKTGILALLCVFLLLFLSGCGENAPAVLKMKANLYFLQANANKITAEQKEITYEREETLPQRVMEELLKGPNSADLRRVIPKETKLLSCTMENTGTVVVNLSAEYLSSGDVDVVMARYSIAQTLCELPGINSVAIQVDGQPIVDAQNNPVGSIAKNNIILERDETEKKSVTVTLYFSDLQAQYLVPERRTVVTNNSDSMEKVIINELLKGPQDTGKAARTMPPGAKLLSVEVKDGTCFVNFSQDFISKHPGGSAGEIMTVYSVVNSLTEIRGNRKVVFLIEGQRVESYINMVFNEAFERDDSLIHK